MGKRFQSALWEAAMIKLRVDSGLYKRACMPAPLVFNQEMKMVGWEIGSISHPFSAVLSMSHCTIAAVIGRTPCRVQAGCVASE